MSLPFDLEIAVKHAPWVEALSAYEEICEQAIGSVLSHLSDPKIGELSLALVDDACIQSLNASYRGKDKPTNVLSFPGVGLFPDVGSRPVGVPAPLLGDIVLAFETVEREALARNISLRGHFTHLLIHGFLHLQGLTHDTDVTAEFMERLEIAALAQLGIDNPYEIREFH